MESKNLFKSIVIQSTFPFLSQFPITLYLIYYSIARENFYEIEIILNTLYYGGQGFCIFLSMIVIKEFKFMMLKDIGIKNVLHPTSNNETFHVNSHIK
uniref:Translocon at the inner envelope membrane of chloroplasts 214 n=1 Tax=Strongyloides papillosus TaxID=174720 RepID=A0A0N5CIJ1_STREA